MAILEVQHVSKSFGNTEVLKDISFSLEKGKVLSLIGSSGSGKTTLLRCLNFLEQPDGGVIRVNGETLFDADDPGTKQESEIRKKRLHFGLVFQSFNLLPRYNALENVALPMIYAGVPARERMERAADALRSVALEERMDHKPNELSGGQKQRVALARALINNPSIILADEPTGNLDTHTSIEIMRLFDEIYRKGNTVIVVTHEEDIAAYAHRIIRLRDGKIESDKENTKYTRTFNPL